MSYKTILVHLTDMRRQANLVDVATSVAGQDNARLVGLCVVPPIVVIAGAEGGPPVIIEEHRTAYRSQMARLRDSFEAATRAQTYQAEWREADPGYADAATLIIDQGRSADLIIAIQTDPEWQYSAQLEAPERLVLESGRPVLLIPKSGTFSSPAKRVVVAWNGKREAARAVFDALPLLQQAKDVVVLWVDPQKDGDMAGDLPGVDICQALDRHGVNCETTQTIRPSTDVGDALLSAVRSHAADLLVMGCYGHSRLREFVFGGASRYVLQHMLVPVLMSH